MSRGPRGTLPLLVATCVAAVAYVDPGNFAADIQSGAAYGDRLLWVVASASVLAMLVQYLAAKLGIVTGRSLPELCRERYSPRTVRLLWLQAEAVCAATDLAEFLGTAIALRLLTGMPLFAGGLVAAALSTALLLLDAGGRQRFGTAVGVLLAVVLGGLLYQASRVGVDRAALSGLMPGLAGAGSLVSAAGIVGATVMPHVVYLHSSMAPEAAGAGAGGAAQGGAAQGGEVSGTGRERSGRIPALLRTQRRCIGLTLGLAGAANLAILVLAAALMYARSGAGTGIDDAYRALGRTFGTCAALVFAVSLLAAGIASAGVGTYAGQVVMQGFLRRTAPLALRRAVTILPALVVLASGVNPATVLLLSQVLLSMGIPFALVPLVLLTRDRTLMGPHANRPFTDRLAIGLTGLLVLLNAVLLATI